MSQIDYPPSRTYRLGAALEAAAERVTDAEARVAQLQEDEDATDQALARARQAVVSATNQRDALEWAVSGDAQEDGFDGWGADAELVVQAFTATSRARILDTRDRASMGPVGGQETRVWLVAGAVQAAPWLDGDEDLVEQQRLVGQLPPGLIDWLDEQLGELNDLTAGN